ncbi:MAG TPA: MaoC/PaaZ C-terminal domain-containing protein [Ornithinimicrobium sp.]|uniref:MaoC/PaaZ C-terminal domain-containing protein n=1 Tax=Ornithinimicrobium sp. TaxID=1977084 RepID=UPI002B469873|nr:MaoC/PaaZ C-terminal domain-containing protein [Ornithinimicrobium sp.]HKJ11319.1 MaoC/PaaZ C-terminal domain-containing protein [Ornithinimicrobium sp.]
MSPRLEDLNVGQIVATRTVSVDRDRLREYAEASGDRNPIHLDEQAARAVGLPGVIAHGMWTMGAAADVVSTWAGDPSAVVGYSTRFTGPVVVSAESGAQVQIRATVSSVDVPAGRVTLDIAVSSAGVDVLRRARAVVQLRPATPDGA